MSKDKVKVVLKVFCGCGGLAFTIGDQVGNEIVEYRESSAAGECKTCSARGGDYKLKRLEASPPSAPPTNSPKMSTAFSDSKPKPTKGGVEKDKNGARASFKDADRDRRKKKPGVEQNRKPAPEEEIVSDGHDVPRGSRQVDWNQSSSHGGRRERR